MCKLRLILSESLYGDDITPEGKLYLHDRGSPNSALAAQLQWPPNMQGLTSNCKRNYDLLPYWRQADADFET